MVGLFELIFLNLPQTVTAKIQSGSQEVFRKSFESRDYSQSDSGWQCCKVTGVTQLTRVKLSKTLGNLQ